MRIKTLAIFSDGPIIEEQIKLVWDWFYFDSYDVDRFNVTDDGFVTLWFNSGESIKVAIKHEDWLKIQENNYQLVVDAKTKYEFEDA